ncbi:MAG: BON domain-containing protein [Holosporaceae bacterium]|jgi:osmotically-inducible protein OsmY|nr:BON domain-containing protein [Holosporaceae bacterium]
MMKVVIFGELALLLFCTACDPVTLAFGGTAVAGATVVRNQEGISGSVSDTKLQTLINHALFKEDKELFDNVELSVKHGMVVVIGYVKESSQHDRIIETVKSVKGVGEVYDEVKIQEIPRAADLAKDANITSRIKSALLFDGNVSSLNYDITTVKSVVYICGTAQSKYERDVVLNQARTTSGVNKVVAYIKINSKNSKENN